jgi:hypothetical protein
MTKPIYEAVPQTGEQMAYIKRTDADGRIYCIPIDEANADYQAYLNKDKAEQSTPSVTSGD